MSEEVNRKCPPRIMMVQLSIPYTDPKRHNNIVTDRRTDDSMMPIDDRLIKTKSTNSSSIAVFFISVYSSQPLASFCIVSH